MRANLKRLTGLSLASGLLLLGAAATPAVAAPEFEPRPLVEPVGEPFQADGFVLSADGATMYVLGSWEDGYIVDTATRQETGRMPAITDVSNPSDGPVQALGAKFALPSYDGYVLVTLADGTVERFELPAQPGEQYPPDLRFVVADANGQVTAIASSGEFLKLDGATVSSATELYDGNEVWPQRELMSSDGSEYLAFIEGVTTVYSMSDGAIMGTIGGTFEPFAFDPSGTSLWGFGAEDYDRETLLNVDIATGAELGRHQMSAPLGWTFFADAEAQWFLAGGGPALGGSLADGSALGGRDLGCCTSALLRLPGSDDMIYYDMEMRTAGFVTGPSITDPANVRIQALGETVTFTSDAEGLALAEDEEGAGWDMPYGSIWQSSADGETWTDLPGETGATLSVVATEASLQLEYRRHFLDPFWGAAPSSQPARMVAEGPKITRADDLPAGTAGAAYPGQVITATGQSGMVWSSADLPAGLTINPATGEITGTPGASGEFEFTVTVKDVFGEDSKLFHLSVTEGEIVPPGPGPDPKPKPEVKPETLPSTGGSSWLPAAAIGAVLLAAGAAGVLVSRRKSAAKK